MIFLIKKWPSYPVILHYFMNIVIDIRVFFVFFVESIFVLQTYHNMRLGNEKGFDKKNV